MKTVARFVVVLICLNTVLISLALAGEPLKTESGWFDYENCAFCKFLLEDPGLLEHSTWENHTIKNGSMNIMVLDPEYVEAMATAEQKMSDLGNQISKGEVNPMTMKMCGHCMSYGMIMMSGVNMERVSGEAAIITMVTSDDPAMVQRLHDHVKRDNEEMALMADHSHQH